MAGMGMGADGAMEMGMGGMEEDMGMGGIRSLTKYVPLESLLVLETTEKAGSKQVPKNRRLTQPELKIVSDSIRQEIWKEDYVQEVSSRAADQDAITTLEPQLKKLLEQQYDTQITRQSLEIQAIEQKVRRLKEELARRTAAKKRVVDVQLGRIVLEAQGLLK